MSRARIASAASLGVWGSEARSPLDPEVSEEGGVVRSRQEAIHAAWTQRSALGQGSPCARNRASYKRGTDLARWPSLRPLDSSGDPEAGRQVLGEAPRCVRVADLLEQREERPREVEPSPRVVVRCEALLQVFERSARHVEAPIEDVERGDRLTVAVVLQRCHFARAGRSASSTASRGFPSAAIAWGKTSK